MTRLRLLLTALALTLAACIAPDGSTITVATVDENRRVQVQTIEVTAKEEHYRGWFNLCLHVTAAETGYADVLGCIELTAHAYQNGVADNPEFIEYWNWELVRQ